MKKLTDTIAIRDAHLRAKIDEMVARSGVKLSEIVRADVPHPRNCLRHSFTSYHVAANKDAARTSVILCHTSPAMLWRHYKGRATEADGLAWFRIVPAGSPPRPAPPVAEKRGETPQEHARTGQ